MGIFYDGRVWSPQQLADMTSASAAHPARGTAGLSADAAERWSQAAGTPTPAAPSPAPSTPSRPAAPYGPVSANQAEHRAQAQTASTASNAADGASPYLSGPMTTATTAAALLDDVVEAAGAYDEAAATWAAYESDVATGAPAYAFDVPTTDLDAARQALDAATTAYVSQSALVGETEADRALYRTDVKTGPTSATPDAIGRATIDILIALAPDRALPDPGPNQNDPVVPPSLGIIAAVDRRLRNERIVETSLARIETAFEDGLETGLQVSADIMAPVADPELRRALGVEIAAIAVENGLYTEINGAEPLSQPQVAGSMQIDSSVRDTFAYGMETPAEARLRVGAGLAAIAPPEVAQRILAHLEDDIAEVLSVNSVDEARHQVFADAAIDNAATIVGKAAEDIAACADINARWSGAFEAAYRQSVLGWSVEEHSLPNALARLADIADHGLFARCDIGAHTTLMRALTESLIGHMDAEGSAWTLQSRLFSNGLFETGDYAALVDDLSIIANATMASGGDSRLALALADRLTSDVDTIEQTSLLILNTRLKDTIGEGHGAAFALALADQLVAKGARDAASDLIAAIGEGVEALARNNSSLINDLVSFDNDLADRLGAVDALAGPDAVIKTLIAWRDEHPGYMRDRGVITRAIMQAGLDTFLTVQTLEMAQPANGTATGHDFANLSQSGLTASLFGTDDAPGIFETINDDPVTHLLYSSDETGRREGNPLVRRQLASAYFMDADTKSAFQKAFEANAADILSLDPGLLRSMRSIVSGLKESFDFGGGDDKMTALIGHPNATMALRGLSTLLYAMGVNKQIETLQGKLTPGELAFGVMYSTLALRDGAQLTGLITTQLPGLRAIIGGNRDLDAFMKSLAGREGAIYAPSVTFAIRLIYMGGLAWRIGEGLGAARQGGQTMDELLARSPQLAAMAVLTLDGLITAAEKGLIQEAAGSFLQSLGTRALFGTGATLGKFGGPIGYAIMLAGELIYAHYRHVAETNDNEGPMEAALVAVGIDPGVAKRISNHDGDGRSPIPFIVDWFNANALTPEKGLAILAEMEEAGKLETFIEEGIHAAASAAYDLENPDYDAFGAPLMPLNADNDPYIGLDNRAFLDLRKNETGLDIDIDRMSDVQLALLTGVDRDPRSMSGLNALAEHLLPGLSLDFDPTYRNAPVIEDERAQDESESAVTDKIGEEEAPENPDPDIDPTMPPDVVPPGIDLGPDEPGTPQDPDVTLDVDGLPPDVIPPGTDITLDPGLPVGDQIPPSGDATHGEPATPDASADPGATTSDTASPPRVHIVEKGETLWGIAVAEGLSLFEVLAVNPHFDAGLADGTITTGRDGRRDPDLILVGDAIILPGQDAA